MTRAWMVMTLALTLSTAGCTGSLMFGDGDDDDATGDDDTGDDDTGDDDTGDDDTADDDTADLLCGPEPALDDIPAGTAVYTGYADVEVNGNWENHWKWSGCQTAWVVVDPGEVYCGVRWTLAGESEWEDPQQSGYAMLLELEVDVDTCGEAEGGWQYLAVYAQQGSDWQQFDMYYYDDAIEDWAVFAASTPGMVHWTGNDSGSGWIEYHSVAFELEDEEGDPGDP